MQFSKINVYELVSENRATDLEAALLLKRAIESQMANNNIVLVSLEKIEEISTEFVNASLVALRDQYGENIFSMYVKIMMPWVEPHEISDLRWNEGWNAQSSFRAAA